eukprot:TRINITY_DN31939_c0_g1_i1.p1 TRINITY_DN31939_c0_g1~~TRINITY_DN31939_c0_g1_i1.p1  ORF type:complete len:420 (+),score=135.04 TRINITY_DN31939_c0_g1_i1:109-1260(+)
MPSADPAAEGWGAAGVPSLRRRHRERSGPAASEQPEAPSLRELRRRARAAEDAHDGLPPYFAEWLTARRLALERQLAAALRRELAAARPAARGCPPPQARASRPRNQTAAGRLWDRPRALLFRDFLSPAEREHIAALAEPLLAASTLDGGGTSGISNRRSRTAFLPSALERSDEVLRLVSARIAAATGIPWEYGEAMQVARYEEGDFYSVHRDSSARMGRAATFLVYLREPEEGGATLFPGAAGPPGTLRGYGLEEPQWDEHDIKVTTAQFERLCEDSRVPRVPPAAGSAVFFFNHHPDLSTDRMSLHGACPVLRGTKMVAQKWLHWHTTGQNEFFSELVQPRQQRGPFERTPYAALDTRGPQVVSAAGWSGDSSRRRRRAKG